MAALAVDVSQAVQLKCFKSQLPSLDYHITQHAKGANIIQHTEREIAIEKERKKDSKEENGETRNDEQRAVCKQKSKWQI